MKKVFVLLFFLFGCSSVIKEKGIELRIINSSNSPISKVKFTTSESYTTLSFKKINPDEKVSEFLSMKKNVSDGNYNLEFFNFQNIKIRKNSGYYTNGSPSEKWIEFEIKKDTVVVSYSKINY